MLPPLEILGICSALVTLSCFILNEYGKVSPDDVRYDLANGLAALGLVSYAISIHAIPFMLTNSVWAIVSFIDVGRYAWGKERRILARRRKPG
jgi:hypothetical protein